MPAAQIVKITKPKKLMEGVNIVPLFFHPCKFKTITNFILLVAKCDLSRENEH